MKKLYEILGQQHNEGDVGIEIEVEGRRLPHDVDGRWNAIEDGSLRGESREYVLAEPLPHAEIKPALKALAKNLKDVGSVLDFSFRTSVHVHINCQDLTYPQYLSFLYTYFLLEEPLMNYCGKERKGNRFCLRLQDAEGMLDAYQILFGMENAFNYIPANQVRYSAMNIEATKKFGSLEFRGMKGNMDIEFISDWVDCLMALRTFAKEMDNPVEVYNLYAELEAQGFMERVLGKLAPKFYYPRVYREIQRSFSLALELPFLYGERVRKAAAKPKKAAIMDNNVVIVGGRRLGGGLFAPPPAPLNVDALHARIAEHADRFRLDAAQFAAPEPNFNDDPNNW